jgi:hypothetical protein
MGSLRSLARQKEKVEPIRFEIRESDFSIYCLDWGSVPNREQSNAVWAVHRSCTRCVGSFREISEIPYKYDDLSVYIWSARRGHWVPGKRHKRDRYTTIIRDIRIRNLTERCCGKS